jgi:hypothetical protein
MMPRTIRFHLDEHCPRAIAEGLRREGIDVTTTPEAGLLGAADVDHLAFALQAKRVVFTKDQEFLRLHAAGAADCGIAFRRKDTYNIGEILEGLILIWEYYDVDDLLGRIEYL